MSSGRYFTTAVAINVGVACVAWVNGWIAGRLLERRNAEPECPPLFLDLADYETPDGYEDPAPCGPPAYDWAASDSGVASAPPTVGIFEWPGGVTIARPTQREEP